MLGGRCLTLTPRGRRDQRVACRATVPFMRSRSRTLLTHLMWSIGGATVGSTAALLGAKHWTPDWVGATGTWFGAIATVLTLLWAVQTFRADQLARELALKEQDAERRHVQHELAQSVVREAGRVTIRVRGGAGSGDSSGMLMSTVHVVFTNDTKEPVTVNSYELMEPALETKPSPKDFRLAPQDVVKRHVEVQPFPADQHEFSDRGVMARVPARMTFRLAGLTWTTTSEPNAKPVQVD